MPSRFLHLRPFLLAAAVCAGAGVVLFQFWGNVTRGYVDTASLWVWWGSQWFDPAADLQHGPWLVLVAAWLAWRNGRHESTPMESIVVERRALYGALGGCSLGLALHAFGAMVQQTRFSVLGALIFAGGVALLGGGVRTGRAVMFPLGFLLLALPAGFLDTLGVGFQLRLAVVVAVEKIAQLLGIEVIRNGTQLFAPDGRYQYDVAAACSGMRSLQTLVALALLLGYLNFTRFWARLLVVIASLPLVFAGNVVRIAAIVLLGQWRGQRSGEIFHDYSGAAVFLIVLGGLLGVVTVMRRYSWFTAPAGRRVSAPDAVGVAPAATPSAAMVVATSIVLLTVVAAVWTARVARAPVESAAGVRLQAGGGGIVEMPAWLGTEWSGHTVEVSAVERETLPADTQYSRKNYSRIGLPPAEVFVSLVLSGRDRTSIHRPEICLVGQGWTIRGREQRRLVLPDGSGLPVTLLRIEREAVRVDGGRGRVAALLVYWFAGRTSVVGTHREMLWRGAWERLRGGAGGRWAYGVGQTLILADGQEAVAWDNLQRVVGQVWQEVRAEPSPSLSP